MTEKDPVSRTGIAGRDMDQARAMYEDGYNGTDFATDRSDREFAFHYRSSGSENMTIRSSMFLGVVQGDIRPENEYVVAWLSEGRATFTVDGVDSTLEPGRPAMFPTGEEFSFSARDFRQNLIHFDAGFLERIAAEHEGSLSGPLHFDHTVVPGDEALARWRRVVNESARSILTGSPSGLQLAEIDRRTAISLLDTFRHEHRPLPPELLLPSNERLRLAVEFMHAHPAEPLSPSLIAEHAGLSPRGLQLAFRRQFDTTPSEYLRAVRLDRVRADLERLGQEETTVGAVASRWGFAHASRFAGAYQARFGEPPSTTLRR
jgi:AraC-like DNA-binding protein